MNALYDEIDRLRAENKGLLEALKLCLPLMTVDTAASHMMDGFRPRKNNSDKRLTLIQAAIAAAEEKP